MNLKNYLVKDYFSRTTGLVLVVVEGEGSSSPLYYSVRGSYYKATWVQGFVMMKEGVVVS